MTPALTCDLAALAAAAEPDNAAAEITGAMVAATATTLTTPSLTGLPFSSTGITIMDASTRSPRPFSEFRADQADMSLEPTKLIFRGLGLCRKALCRRRAASGAGG